MDHVFSSCIHSNPHRSALRRVSNRIHLSLALAIFGTMKFLRIQNAKMTDWKTLAMKRVILGA